MHDAVPITSEDSGTKRAETTVYCNEKHVTYTLDVGHGIHARPSTGSDASPASSAVASAPVASPQYISRRAAS